MTRHILTTATLVAFLAAGQAPAPAGERRREADAASRVAAITTTAPQIVEVDGHLVAIAGTLTGNRAGVEVAVQLEPDHRPAGMELWFGARNGLGVTTVPLLAEPALAGFHHAVVVLPDDPATRLWLGIQRPQRRAAIIPVACLDP